MSASDSIGYFVELGEYNLVIARATLGPKPRTVQAIKEVWLGDAAAADGLVNEIRPAGAGAKAIALLRIKSHSTILADAAQGKSITAPEAVENFLRTTLGAENTPANWAWYAAGNGLVPQGGARWLLDAAPTANTEESLGKLRGWNFELMRCQSAPLTLAGAIATATKSGSTLLVEISEQNTTLIALSSQGVTGVSTIPVGLDALAGSTQTALGLKFRGSAGRLMFNESYDFSETGAAIVEPLATAIKGALPGLGNPAQFVCSGILARQSWITQALAKATNLTPFTADLASWSSSRGLAFDGSIKTSEVGMSWLGVLNAVATHEIAQPGNVRAWNPLLTNTPVAPNPIIPAILIDPPAAKPTPPPAIATEPQKTAAAPTKPTEAVKPTEPAKAPEAAKQAAAPAKPAEPVKPATPAAAPKPAVIITPPAKPAEPAKSATPPAKPATPPAKPTEPAKPATPPAKPAEPAKPTGAPAPKTAAPVAKPAPKPEPVKPSPTSKPAPAPVVSNSPIKPATAAPFPAKKNNLIVPIAIAAAIIIGVVVFFVINGNNRAKAEAEAREKLRIETEAKIKAKERELAEQQRKTEEERRAREKEQQEAELRMKAQQDLLRQQQEAERNKLLYGRGILVVNTDPAGATVTVDQYGAKTAPLTLKDMRLGPYTVTISMPGYDTETRTFEIKDKETTDLGTITLNRQVGSVELSSEPSNLAFELKPAGALFVNLGDVRSGQTPATLSGVPVGSYNVTINRPNWPSYTSTVTVERNGTAYVRGEFNGGTVVINSNIPGAEIFRDNQVKIGVAPLTLNGIPPGSVSFTLVYRGCDPVTVTGKMESGQTLTLNAVLMESDRVMKQSELDERPSPISQADPDISTALRETGGTALISLVVGKDGVPTDLSVVQASDPSFGKACLEAASKWRFRPGSLRGKPARCRVTIPFKVAAE